MKTVMVFMVFALLLMYGMTAVAHEEGEESGSEMKMDMKNMDMKMMMQHRTMDVIAEHWGETQEALKERDWKEAGGDVAEIVEAAKKLKGFKPHRNADRIKDFMKIQGVFVKRLGCVCEETDRSRQGHRIEGCNSSGQTCRDRAKELQPVPCNVQVRAVPLQGALVACQFTVKAKSKNRQGSEQERGNKIRMRNRRSQVYTFDIRIVIL